MPEETGAGMGTLTRSPMLQRLYDERQQLVDFVDQTVAGANTEGQIRDLSQTEQESLTRTRDRITAIDGQIRPLEEFEQLRAAGNAAAHNFRPTPAAMPRPEGDHVRTLGARTDPRAWRYRSWGEVIVDQLRAAPAIMGGSSDDGARERLLSAGVVYAGLSDADVAIAKANARRAAQDLALNGTQSRATQVTGDTPGILPVPIIGEIMSDVDAARPFITSLGAKNLAFAGETFKRPVITQHTAVGKQTTQATTTGVGTQKLVIGSVTFTKETWGGYLDVSRQDIDWTSPAAWDAILNDLTEQYGLQTETAAVAALVAAVTQNTAVATGAQPLSAYITSLYASAALAYAGAGGLPDVIWMSLGMWGLLGPLLEAQVATNLNPGSGGLGEGAFNGNLLQLPRLVVPSMAGNILILGRKRWTEVYEERIGLLQAVQPSAFGVQVAYGGYVAYNTLKAGAFAKVTKTP